eukprot:5913196-Prymnesium_polylepis.1
MDGAQLCFAARDQEVVPRDRVPSSRKWGTKTVLQLGGGPRSCGTHRRNHLYVAKSSDPLLLPPAPRPQLSHSHVHDRARVVGEARCHLGPLGVPAHLKDATMPPVGLHQAGIAWEREREREREGGAHVAHMAQT